MGARSRAGLIRVARNASPYLLGGLRLAANSSSSSASASAASGFSYCSASATYAGPGTSCAFADSVNNAWTSQVGGGGTDKFPVRLTTADGTAVTCTANNVTATYTGPHGETVWFQQ